MTGRIRTINRIVLAITKHILRSDSCARYEHTIRIDKSAGLGVIVAGLEIVEPGFVIVVIATIAERIEVGNMGGVGRTDGVSAAILDTQRQSPRIVGVLRHLVAVAVHDLGDIALPIIHIVVIGRCAAVFIQETIPGSRLIIQIGQRNIAGGIFPHNGIAAQIDGIGMSTYCFGSADAAIVVGVGKCLGILGQRSQLATVLPRHGEIAIDRRVTNVVVGNAAAIIGR